MKKIVFGFAFVAFLVGTSGIVNAQGRVWKLHKATYEVDENAANGTELGTVTYSQGQSGIINFSIKPKAFAIDPTTGLITVADSAALDCETLQDENPDTKDFVDIIATVKLRVYDTGGQTIATTEEEMEIKIKDVDDAGAPKLLDSDLWLVENPSDGDVLGIPYFENPEKDDLTWSLSGTNLFTIDSLSGEIKVIDSSNDLFDHETLPNDTSFSVTMSDKWGNTQTANIKANISDEWDGAQTEVVEAYDDVFAGPGVDINNIDTECMLDLLNDRLGINMGTPFEMLGEGVGLFWDDGGDALSGLGQNLGDIDINDMGLDDLMNIINPGNKPVFDGPGLQRGARIIRCNIDRGVSTEQDLRVLLIGWVNYALLFVGLIAVIALIYAGFLYITTGAEDGAEKAKKIILYVVIGILLILGSYAIVNTLISAPRAGAGDEIVNLQTTPKPYTGP